MNLTTPESGDSGFPQQTTTSAVACTSQNGKHTSQWPSRGHEEVAIITLSDDSDDDPVADGTSSLAAKFCQQLELSLLKSGLQPQRLSPLRVEQLQATLARLATGVALGGPLYVCSFSANDAQDAVITVTYLGRDRLLEDGVPDVRVLDDNNGDHPTSDRDDRSHPTNGRYFSVPNLSVVEAVDAIAEDFQKIRFTAAHRERVWNFFMKRFEMAFNDSMDEQEIMFATAYASRLIELQNRHGHNWNAIGTLRRPMQFDNPKSDDYQ